MKKKILASIIAVALGLVGSVSQANEVKVASETENRICLLTGMPPSDITFQEIKKLKIGMHGYGSVNDVIPLLVNKGKHAGANAIIKYNGSQRFGFWPWQFVRPTATGIAVTWTLPDGTTCEKIGGTYKTRLNGPLTTDA